MTDFHKIFMVKINKMIKKKTREILLIVYVIYGSLMYTDSNRTPGGHSIIKNTGGWLNSLGSAILVGKRYFGVLQKY